MTCYKFCFFRAFRGNNRFGGNGGGRNGYGGRNGFGNNDGKPNFQGGRNGIGGMNAGKNGFGGADRRGPGPQGLKGTQPGGGLKKPQWDMNNLPVFSKNFYIPHFSITNR